MAKRPKVGNDFAAGRRAAMDEAARRAALRSLEQARTGLRPAMQALRDLADELTALAKNLTCLRDRPVDDGIIAAATMPARIAGRAG